MAIVEQLFSSSLIALVGSGEEHSPPPRMLRIFNTKTGQIICELNFITPILAVRLNKRRLIVVLESKIHIYELATMKHLHIIDTTPNPKGIIGFSPADNCYLVYPGGKENGEVYLFDALDVHSVRVVSAHKGPISTIAFSHDGALFATASQKGTVLRIFSTQDASKSYSLRRGSSPASIYSLSFNASKTILCASSSTGTVHLFKLESQNSSAGLVSSYLPEMISEIWEPFRAFTSLKLPFGGVKSLCAIRDTDSSLFVVTENGDFCQYRISGTECKLVHQHSLLPNSSTDLDASFSNQIDNHHT